MGLVYGYLKKGDGSNASGGNKIEFEKSGSKFSVTTSSTGQYAITLAVGQYTIYVNGYDDAGNSPRLVVVPGSPKYQDITSTHASKDEAIPVDRMGDDSL